MNQEGSVSTDAEGDDLSTIYSVELWRVQDVVDPFQTDVWSVGAPITRQQVEAAILEKRFQPVPGGAAGGVNPARRANPFYDVERVAYLVVHPTDDPINLETICEWGDTIIHDGCHRIAAAIFRGDPRINVDYGGYVDAFMRRFVNERVNDGTQNYGPELVSDF